MRAKLLTIASSALFVIASNLAASASTYDVSGGWLFPADTFSGPFDFAVGTNNADITLYSLGKVPKQLAVLDDVVSLSPLGGPLYSVTVNNGNAKGDYSLTFDFTLPTTKHDGIAIFATLSEVICTGRGDKCSDKIIADLGGGSITPDLSLSDPSSPSATPLPAALPLFAGGLGVIGLVAGRRKRKSAGLAAA
jgi:hypothetical protein